MYTYIEMLQFVECQAAQRKSAGCFEKWVGLQLQFLRPGCLEF